jgi:hypothetical protein
MHTYTLKLYSKESRDSYGIEVMGNILSVWIIS